MNKKLFSSAHMQQNQTEKNEHMLVTDKDIYLVLVVVLDIITEMNPRMLYLQLSIWYKWIFLLVVLDAHKIVTKWDGVTSHYRWCWYEYKGSIYYYNKSRAYTCIMELFWKPIWNPSIFLFWYYFLSLSFSSYKSINTNRH